MEPNEPAYPAMIEESTFDGRSYIQHHAGIDIRTLIAKDCLAALISYQGGLNPELNATMALENADELIKKLNEAS